MPKFQFARFTKNGDAEELFSDNVENTILALSSRLDKQEIKALAGALNQHYKAYKTLKLDENSGISLTAKQSSLAVKLIEVIDSYDAPQSSSVSARLNACCLRTYIPLRHPKLSLNAYRINQLKESKKRALREAKDTFLKSEQALISAIENDPELLNELQSSNLLITLEMDLLIREGEHSRCSHFSCF
ncbi:MAG: hypothetical protein ABSF18_00310 [Gammaproteobacteria bacterium]|jgi:hypothetical protein